LDGRCDPLLHDHAFIQSLRRGHHDLGMEGAPKHRLADAFDELALAM
jgi:hypothetical protein